MQRKLLGIIYVDLDAIGQLLIIYSAFVEYHEEGSSKSEWLEIKWYTLAFRLC